jgi:hypothetical protein
MRKGFIAVLSLLVAAVAPTAVNARSYSDDGYRYSRHTRTSHRHAGGSAGTSMTCLTSAARNLLGRIRNHFGNLEIVSTCRPGAVIAGTRTIRSMLPARRSISAYRAKRRRSCDG